MRTDLPDLVMIISVPSWKNENWPARLGDDHLGAQLKESLPELTRLQLTGHLNKPMNEAHKWLRVTQSSLISISHASCIIQASYSKVLRAIQSSPGPISSVRTFILHNPRNLLERSQIFGISSAHQSPADGSPHLHNIRNQVKSSQITEDIHSSPVSSWKVTWITRGTRWKAHKSLRAIQSSLISISCILHQPSKLTKFLELPGVYPAPSQVCAHVFYYTTQGTCWNAHKYLGYPVLTSLQLTGHLHNTRNRLEAHKWLRAVHTATAIPSIYSFSGNSAASAPISTFMSLWAIYIFSGSVHIFPPAEKADPSWEYIIRSQIHHTWMWKLGLRPQNSFSGNICLKFSAFCLCCAELSNFYLTCILHNPSKLAKYLELSRAHPASSQVCVHVFYTIQGICWKAHTSYRAI
jgi:hypothetical protein